MGLLRNKENEIHIPDILKINHPQMFAPIWLMKKILSDWDDVIDFEVIDIQNWSDKAYCLTVEFIYLIDENLSRVTNDKIFVPKRFLIIPNSFNNKISFNLY